MSRAPLPIRHQLKNVVRQCFLKLSLPEDRAEVIASDRPDLADYQCNGALAVAKSLKKNPRELAEQVVATLCADAAFKREGEVADDSTIGHLSIAGPGFINIKLTSIFLEKWIHELSSDPRGGIPKVEKPATVVIDFGSPNVAKTMHVGHLRSSIIGDALQRIFRFRGDRVIADNHIGDWGTPMGMLISEVKRRDPSLPYFSDKIFDIYPSESPVTMADLEEMYPKASIRFKEDEAEKTFVLKTTDELQKGRVGYRKLWEHFVNVTFQGLNRDFGALGIAFDHWYGESFYEEKMPPLIERLKKSGIAVVDEGALVIRLDHLGENTPPLILVKKDGGYLYATSDMATVEFRVAEWNPDFIFYIVDKRQSMHFKQLFEAAKIAGLNSKASLEHLAFGTMNGPDGKPFKTRAGGVLKLNDVIQMVIEQAKLKMNELGVAKEYPAEEFEEIARKVGIATLKFSDLKNNRIADYIFDLDKFSRFEGYTGPYLLYAAVRIQSLLKKAEGQGFVAGQVSTPTLEVERRLIMQLARLPEAFETIVNLREPHFLCQFGFDLSQSFNAFYKECHILSETDESRRASWLELCRLTHLQLGLVLGLLGIEIPNRM